MSTAPAGRKRPHSNAALAMLTLVGIALFVGFISLGVWQVQRRAWKLDLIERVTQRLQAPPAALPPAAQWPQINAASHEYQPVRLQGRWLEEKTVLTQATTALGAGYWVLTPLQLGDERNDELSKGATEAGGQGGADAASGAGRAQVLINRGFVPQDQRAQWQPGAAASADHAPVTVVGLLRMTEPGGGFLRRNDPAQQRWHSRDVAAIAQAQQLAHAAPFFVDAGLPPRQGSGSADLPAASGPWPRQGLTVVRFANSHLVYALTWFGLALMVVGAAVVVARYELRLRAAHSKTPAHEQQP